MKKILIASALFAVVLSGCAVQNDKTQFRGLGLTYNSGVTKDSDGNYVAAVEAAPLAGRIGGAEAYVLSNATAYCTKQGKIVKVIKQETDSHLLLNGVAKLTFQCV